MRLTTTTALLSDLRNAGHAAAWGAFDARYRPILVALARRLDLDPDDAEDVAQETLAEFAREYLSGKYDRERGRLSGWILGIARHRALDALRRRAVRRGEDGDTALADLPGPDDLAAAWAAERRRVILAEAIRILPERTKMEPATLRAFELATVRGVPAAQAAAECGMTTEEVYVAKARVAKRLREIATELTAAYDEDG